MLEFETEAGNRYLYCTELNLVFPENNSDAKKIIGIIDAQGMSEKTVNFLSLNFENHPFLSIITGLYNFQNVYDVLWKKRNLKIPNEGEIQEHLYKHGFQEMTLGVTEACNMRCKYCVYSEMYKFFRNQSFKHMGWKIAKSAIDLYFKYLKEGEPYNPKRRATIGFYGGEPLLNFPLIKKCVKYTKKYQNFRPFFTITTNGTLLNDEIVDFIIENKINLIVSIDGSKEEHNRKRILSNGNGSFDIVMKNVKKVMDRDYPLFAVMVYDWKTDFLEEQKFFNREDVPPLIFVNPVSLEPGCKYYDQFTLYDIKKFKKMLGDAEKFWFKELKGEVEEVGKASVIEIYALMRILRMFTNAIVLNKPTFLPYTGACVPGVKMFVDCDGNIHTCEKINSHFPIGNVNTGLNFSKIRKIIEEYHENILEHCKNCPIKNICGLCYTIFGEKGNFKLDPGICEDHINATRKAFKLAYSSMEINPRIEEMISGMFEELVENRVIKEML
ncbi:MAG: radical SAM protein [Euryarchaeota archaeon]|nr:radical SAM protein [Euryarchaeota archaeon]